MKKWLLLSALSTHVCATDPFASFDGVVVDSSVSSVGLTGYAQSSLQYLTRSSEWGSLRQRLWLEPYYHAEKSGFTVESAFSLDWDPSVGARKDAKEWHAQVRELYASWQQEQRSISVGKLMMIWGSGSVLSQGNYFNPTDSSDPLASGLAVNFLAKPAVRWREYLGDDVVEFIVTAEPTVAELALKGSMWDRVAPEVRTAFERESFANPTELGFGYQINHKGFDLFVGGAYVYQDDPAIVSGSKTLRLEREKVASAFIQYNVNFWDGVAQLQARYDDKIRVVTDTENDTLAEQWSLLAGWSGYVQQVNTEIEVLFMHQADGKVVTQLSQNYHYEWGSGEWSSAFGAVFNFDDHSSLIELKLNYKPSDSLEYSLGYNGFYGDKQSNYGAYQANSMLVGRLNFYF